MRHYDELKPEDSPAAVPNHPYAGPTVVRDCPNVRVIAENAPDFIGVVRPRYMDSRDADWRGNKE